MRSVLTLARVLSAGQVYVRLFVCRSKQPFRQPEHARLGDHCQQMWAQKQIFIAADQCYTNGFYPTFTKLVMGGNAKMEIMSGLEGAQPLSVLPWLTRACALQASPGGAGDARGYLPALHHLSCWWKKAIPLNLIHFLGGKSSALSWGDFSSGMWAFGGSSERACLRPLVRVVFTSLSHEREKALFSPRRSRFSAEGLVDRGG